MKGTRRLRRGFVLAGVIGAFLSAGTSTASADQVVFPYVDCVAPQTPSATSFTVEFGYINFSESTVHYNVGPPFNYLFPGDDTAPGQISNFLPGWHPRAFTATFDNGSYISTESLRWVLGDVTANAQSPVQSYSQSPTNFCGPWFEGEWNSSRRYLPQESVTYGGSSWTAVVTSLNSAPSPASPVWTQAALAGTTGAVGPTGLVGPTGSQGVTGATGLIGPIGLTGHAGPTGDAGLVGATGPGGAVGLTGPGGNSGTPGERGAAGPTGPIGPATATPTGPVGGKARFNGKGIVTVRNSEIRPDSLVTLQYMGAGLRNPRPTVLTSVKRGSFSAVGAKRARFVFTVINP